MVVTIDLENLASYEKYQGETDRRCRGKRDRGIREKSGCILVEAVLILSSEDEPERMRR
jgi:hypothetical protein